jgi:phenylacetate-CoA ligase
MLTTPSFACHLGHILLEQGYPGPEEHRMKTLIVAGEPGGSIDATRKAILDAWGDVNIGEVYGFSEIMGSIAGSCPVHEGLHVAEDCFIIETLREDRDEPVPDGEIGEITVTALNKKTRPMIRYRSGDYGLVNRNVCACGRTHARVTVKGRLDDMFIINGVNIHPSDIEQVIRACPALGGMYRIRVGCENFSNYYDVEAERAPATTASEREIAEKLAMTLKKILRAKPRKITILTSGSIPISPMKSKRIIDERKQMPKRK